MLDALISIQRWIYASLAADLSGFAATRDWKTLLAVLPLGVVFGAVHALTPGHGKSVLASYLIGSRLAALRALSMAGVLALTHVASAVLLAVVATQLVTRTLSGAGRAPALELISRGMLLAIGVWFVVRALRGRAHVHGEGLAVGFVAGLVPCPLTLFAMFFALGRGVPEAGLVFAVAMALGITLTLCIVALAAVLARQWVLRIATAHGAAVDKISRLLDGTAGALLVAIALYDLRR